MTDLNHLFFVPKPQPLPSQTYSKPFTSYQQPPTRNLFGVSTLPAQPVSKPAASINSTLTTPLRRSQKQLSKTIVENGSMLEEVGYFKKLAYQEFLKKAVFLAGVLVLFGVLGVFKGKICFEMVLFAVSLFTSESRIIENRTIQLFLKTLPILTYTALSYDILTLNNYSGQYYITLANLPALLISLLATLNFLFFRQLSFVSEESLRTLEINLKLTQIVNYFGRKYLTRVKNNLKLYRYVLTMNLAAGFVFVWYCVFALDSVLFKETVWTVPAGVLVVAMVDLLVYAVEFLAREVFLFNLKSEFYQVQVCMALLRLKNNGSQQCEKMHERCLIEIARQLKANSDYLDTPVKINYAINTYRDIFQIHASEQLSSLLSTVNDLSVMITRNNKISESTKTIKQDMFIHFRKIYAQLQNNLLILRLLKEIEKRKLVFLIMVRLAADSPLRTRILETLNDVRNAAKKPTKSNMYFEISERKLNDWLNELENLQRAMSDARVGMRVTSVSERDQNGWAHYKRKNVLDVQEN